MKAPIENLTVVETNSVKKISIWPFHQSPNSQNVNEMFDIIVLFR